MPDVRSVAFADRKTVVHAARLPVIPRIAKRTQEPASAAGNTAHAGSPTSTWFSAIADVRSAQPEQCRAAEVLKEER
jgi:hypothetical protein